MSDGSLAYLGAGFLVAWIVIGAYVVRLWRLQRNISRRIEEVERRSPPPGAG